MAIFNPAPPDINPPEFLRYSKPVTTPAYQGTEADRSGSIALNTVATGLEQGVKLADDTVKSVLDEKIRGAAESERDDYTAQLTNTRAAQTGKAPLDILAGMPDRSNTPIPTAIGSGLNSLQTLQGAMDSSKISETTYYGRQAMIMKGLRAAYPGYVDYIDQKASSILGVNPANAYVRSIIEDINRSGENTKNIAKETESELFRRVSAGNQSLMPTLQAFREGRIDVNKAASVLADDNATNYKRDQRVADLNAKKADDAETYDNAKTTLSLNTGERLTQFWKNIKVPSGLDTDQGLATYLETHAKLGDIDEKKAQQDGMFLQHQRDTLAADMLNDADSSGITKKMRGDTTAIKTVINDRLKPLDDAIQSIYNKDYGRAHAALNFNESVVNDATANQYKNGPKEISDWMLMAGMIQKAGGPQVAGNFFKDTLIADIPSKLKAWVGSRQLGMTTQPEQNTTGEVRTLQDAISDAKESGTDHPKAIKALVGTVDKITDPSYSDELKLNLAKAYFDPKDRGVLNKFIEENGDRVSTYNRLTNPDVTKEMYRLGKKDPQVWQNYKSWAEGEFGTYIFRTELSNMRSLQGTMEKDAFHVHYDDKNSRFEIRDRNDQELSGVMKVTTYGLQKDINRINSGLNTLKEIHKQDGGDASTTSNFLLGQIRSFGYNPTEPKSLGTPLPGMFDHPASADGDILSKVWTSVLGSNEHIQEIKQRKADHDRKVRAMENP